MQPQSTITQFCNLKLNFIHLRGLLHPDGSKSFEVYTPLNRVWREIDQSDADLFSASFGQAVKRFFQENSDFQIN